MNTSRYSTPVSGAPNSAGIVARDLRARHDLFVVTCSFHAPGKLPFYALGKPPGLFPASALEHGIHGGSV